MASVFLRGPRSAPRWYARWKDAAGRWRSQKTAQQTRQEALAIARALEAQEERRRFGVDGPSGSELTVGELMERWAGALANRAAYSNQRSIAKHLIPRFGSLYVQDITRVVVLEWIDELRSTSKLMPASQRGLFGLLSRFCSWATDREFMESNPCRLIPERQRPQGDAPHEGYSISEERLERAMALFPVPFGYLFFLGNRCGLKTGEACGIRMSDFDNLAAGKIRVRFTGSQPLIKRPSGPPKAKPGGSRRCRFVEVPSGVYAATALNPWLERRRAEGAGAEDLVFPRDGRDGRFPFNKDQVGAAFRKIRDQLGLPGVSWRDATRASCATKMAKEGNNVYRISQVLGHSSVLQTEEALRHLPMAEARSTT